MKKLLMVTLLPLALTGCGKISPEYQKAAETIATEQCDGISHDFNHVFGIVSDAEGMFYTCISDGGSERIKIVYKDNPVKYFNFEED